MFWTKLLSLCILLPIVYSIDADYYAFPIRSQSAKTCNRLHKLLCQLKCGTELGACVTNKCYCVSIRLSDSVPGDSIEDVDYSDKAVSNKDLDGASIIKHSVSKTRPVLRHHIAHFCPNLDEARKCIRKCMMTGKPAFCGKDHVCYCGHEYSNMDDDTKYDPEKTYAQFQDLYTKYFGPNY